MKHHRQQGWHDSFYLVLNPKKPEVKVLGDLIFLAYGLLLFLSLFGGERTLVSLLPVLRMLISLFLHDLILINQDT